MYEFVSKSESDKYCFQCSRILNDVCSRLKEKGVETKYSLVGSGSRGMVMRNGDGPFDLDYNLEIVKAPEKYKSNLHRLKELIRVSLNNVSKAPKPFFDAKDSTSVLMSILYLDDHQSFDFSFDVAIVGRNGKGNLCKLVHNKRQSGFGPQGQFVWNEVPDSHNIDKMAEELKRCGCWDLVRNCYRYKKNLYLRRKDNNHPSFVVYIEAVNKIYQEVKGGKRK